MRIIHIMKDGTRRDSIEGIVIPKGEFYQVLQGIVEKKNGGNT
jgi:hypothetical protein